MASTVGIVVFPGSCDEADAARAVRRTPGLEPHYLWHADDDLGGVDAVIVPGGFSYGDYLRAGAIARFAPMMDQVARFAAGGGPVLGICNGFQVLCEAGLLPGALLPNTSLRFVCRQVDVRVEHSDSVFTRECEPGEVLSLPVKHSFGRWYAPTEQLAALEAAGQLVLRYTPSHNPNGSVRDVAGVTNERGNVLGLMPHPEHAVDELNGSADAGRLFGSLAATLGALSPAAA
jgi:phosphoribosylformylglycinamidine synthase subunit PurQ / glutaminase